MIAVEVPPIIARQTWAAAQAQLVENTKKAKRNAKKEYLLSRMVECGCGKNMHGLFSRSRSSKGVRDYLYYRCSLQAGRFFDVEGRACRQPTVWADVLEFAVWRYAERLITGDFEAELRKAQAAEQNTLQPKRDELEALESMIGEAAEDATRNAREMSGYQESERDRPSYKALRKQRDEADERHAELIKRRARLMETIEQGALSDRQIESLLEYRQTTLIGLDNLTPADKREMLEELQTQVKVTGYKAAITCRLKVLPEEIDLFELRNGTR
jgi:site-specific DNA recombinase